MYLLSGSKVLQKSNFHRTSFYQNEPLCSIVTPCTAANYHFVWQRWQHAGQVWNRFSMRHSDIIKWKSFVLFFWLVLVAIKGYVITIERPIKELDIFPERKGKTAHTFIQKNKMKAFNFQSSFLILGFLGWINSLFPILQWEWRQTNLDWCNGQTYGR